MRRKLRSGRAQASAPSRATLEGLTKGKWALFAAEAVHEAHGNLPFVDVWWTFKAFDYLITYQLLDRLNPGYLRRYEQKQKRERGGMT